MLKISGESLAGDNEQGFDFDILNDLSNNIKKIS
jgi:uridylate kinase